MRRRDFLKITTMAAGTVALGQTSGADEAAGKPERPNVLWISVEDISPDLGCYDDAYAVTPHIDAFAAQAVRFDACFATMGVCAPARSGIITGTYPTSIGTNHMRCRGVPPPVVKCFPEYLRGAGYYCTNRSKTDYQFNSPATAWDVSGRKGHWRGRPKGQPFFSVINLGTTHESQIRNARRRAQIEASLGPNEKHAPAKAKLPPYYPDTPIVRRDWAQYYDIITLMDKEVGRILKDLEDDGLADSTLVWFWGDHGRGLPRGKRWIYDSGLRAPLIVRVPERFRKLASPGNPNALASGTANGDLVSFIDFAPTMLSLCGVRMPSHMQGQAFLGPQKAKPRRYIFGARDRVDETYDMIRCVRDKRYKYIRNFMPHLPRSLDVDYMNKMPTMQEMRRLRAEGKLKGAEMQYFEPTKPVEELYDTLADPHEVVNLATDPKHRATVERLRRELFAWMKDVGDFGLIPECEFDEMKRPGDRYEVTAAPGVSATPRGDAVAVALTCNTPGASIAYRIDGAKGAPAATGTFLGVMSAKMHGKGARRRGGRVTAWRDPKTWFSWQVELKKPGRIPVHVHQAYARREPGSRYVLSVGESRLEGRVQPTGGWDKFRFIKIGEVDVPKPGKVTVSIKPMTEGKRYSMDLRAVVLNGKDLAGFKPPGPWQCYAGPISLAPGQTLTAKACRLGFRDSKTVRFRPGDPAVPAARAEARPHWRQQVDKSGVIDRLLAIKALDGQGTKAAPAYVKALTGDTRDPSGAVRYWAVVGLHTCGYTQPVPNRKKTRIDVVRRCLDDPSPAVRIAAAQALCDWGEADAGLPVLVEALKHQTGTARLYAATALNQIGESARPTLPAIQAAMKDKLGYVRRMCGHTIGYLTQG